MLGVDFPQLRKLFLCNGYESIVSCCFVDAPKNLINHF